MKILIVEDDVMVADMLEESLVAAGFVVCGLAHTTAKAIEMAEIHRPELAIIDINLGAGGDGGDIPRLLRPNWSIGILFASGIGDRDQLFLAGGTALIVKPYSLRDLIATMMIVHDIVTTGASTRRVPTGAHVLHQPRPAADAG
jgi:DNA-binding response OmpR family regulator